MTSVATNPLTKPVSDLSIRSGGRFVIAQSSKSFSNYDIELKKFTTTNLGVKQLDVLKWLDRYHTYYVQHGQLQVLEFDGANRHAITPASGRYDAVQSSNAKYIYSFVQTDDGIKLQRTQMIID
jgi:hypothetical protein